MEREQQNVNNASGDNDANIHMGNIDIQKTELDIMSADKENLINTDITNIDTIREDSKDSDALNMDINKNDSKSNDSKSNDSKSNVKADLKAKLETITKTIAKLLEGTWNSYINISRGNLLYPLLFFIGSILYLEVILHILIYRSIDIKIIYPLLFAIPLGAFLAFITGLFRPGLSKIVTWIITILICIVFLTQLVYYSVFKVYFSFQSLGMAGDAISEFGSDIVTAIKANIGGIILLLIPIVILALIISNLIEYDRRGIKEQGVLLGASLIFQIVAMVALLLFGKGDY